MKLYANAKSAAPMIDDCFSFTCVVAQVVYVYTVTFPDVIVIFTGYRRAPNICHVWISL